MKHANGFDIKTAVWKEVSFVIRRLFIVWYVVLLFFILGIDGLDFLFDKFHVVFQFLHLSVHLVNETVAFFTAGIEKSEVVLVGVDLLFESLVASHEPASLVIQCVHSSFGHILEVAFEIVKFAASHRDVEVYTVCQVRRDIPCISCPSP